MLRDVRAVYRAVDVSGRYQRDVFAGWECDFHDFDMRNVIICKSEGEVELAKFMAWLEKCISLVPPESKDSIGLRFEGTVEFSYTPK
jgi:hypothetical protein